MKRFIALMLALIFALSFAACGTNDDSGNSRKKKKDNKTETTALTENEQLLVDLLIKISEDYHNPTSVRVKDIGDYMLYDASDYYGMGYGEFYGVKVILQYGNEETVTVGGPILIRMITPGNPDAARTVAENYFDENLEYWQKDWDECPSDEYPRNTHSTFEEFRESMVQFYIDYYIFADEESARAAAEEDFDDSLDYWTDVWNNAAEDEYPRKYYSSFEEYREGLIETKMSGYIYPCPTGEDVPDRSGRYTRLNSSEEISEDAYDMFDIKKINDALQKYWAKYSEN